MTILLLAAGLLLLLAGGEALVRGAVSLAVRLNVSPLVIGLTLVGFGTSMPELFTSVQAALAGSPAIAVGNIVGSNIANVLLILGIATLLMPIAVERRALMRDGALLIGATLLFAALCFSGSLGRGAGIALLAGLVLYLGILWHQERGTPAQAPQQAAPSTTSPLAALLIAAAGLAMIVFGARFLIDGAVMLARAYDISEAVIGLTVVAIGTSLPELATSIVAALRRQPDVAFGNIIGSNIFNLLGIGGVTALIHPLEIPDAMRSVDIPVMVLVTLALLVVAWTGLRIVRVEGALLLAGFAAHQALLWT
ncbi:calcium/sodium antiporter [Tepidamorphus sp. 3E244]|uniref:calcium/sodium antiporter n=1 Tax=Tepidamorphus sp. 3E244 TaxID=3385498 RepID=UPI0038FD3C4B